VVGAPLSKPVQNERDAWPDSEKRSGLIQHHRRIDACRPSRRHQTRGDANKDQRHDDTGNYAGIE